jgi:2-C-methyl-D-erythritol 4-phosphate cytidylyltransferase
MTDHTSPVRVAVIIPAAGSASRYIEGGAVRHKLDEDLGGKPVLQRTLETFTKFDSDEVSIADIIVAGPHNDDALSDFKLRHADRLALLGARIVRGGAIHRWQTVAAALTHVAADCPLIAIHDAARPCVPFDVLHRVFRAARRHGAAIPAVPATDTLKRTTARDAAHTAPNSATANAQPDAFDRAAAILGISHTPQDVRVVERTLPREHVVAVQTPQCFDAALLRKAYDAIASIPQAEHASITDDASLVERLGAPVVVVEGDPRNIKITRPADIDLARALMGFRAPEGRATHKKF